MSKRQHSTWRRSKREITKSLLVVMWRGKDSAIWEGKFCYDIVMTARNNIFFLRWVHLFYASFNWSAIQSMSIEFSTFQCAHPWPQPLPENASWHCCTQCGCNHFPDQPMLAWCFFSTHPGLDELWHWLLALKQTRLSSPLDLNQGILEARTVLAKSQSSSGPSSLAHDLQRGWAPFLLKFVPGGRPILLVQPWLDFRAQHLEIMVLVDLDTRFNENEGAFLSTGCNTGPHHNTQITQTLPLW